MADKNNFLQALMHMIKGNLGAGILAMPTSFAHSGLLGGLIGLPILCLIATYCVHLLLKSANHIGARYKITKLDYATLAEHSFKGGPRWSQRMSLSIAHIVDSFLLITQLGVCCVYIVFVVENVHSVLKTYQISITKTLVFVAVFPIILLLSFIKTLKRLSIASMVANILQAVGLSLILEYLLRDLNVVDFEKRDLFRPFGDSILGFGSAMFAFEGISVVLPIFSRINNPLHMTNCMGVVNLSFTIILILYFVVGLFGYLRFGNQVMDSITLNLPAEPLYDAVRLMFAASIALTYPLQLYVPNEIISDWIKMNLLSAPRIEENVVSVATCSKIVPQTHVPSILGEKVTSKSTIITQSASQNNVKKEQDNIEMPGKIVDSGGPIWHEYYCRTFLVLGTFVFAATIPHLNLLMDLVGSLSGTILSLTLPAIIHLSTFWNETKGIHKAAIICVDIAIIVFSLGAGTFGSVESFLTILRMLHK